MSILNNMSLDKHVEIRRHLTHTVIGFIKAARHFVDTGGKLTLVKNKDRLVKPQVNKLHDILRKHYLVGPYNLIETLGIKLDCKLLNKHKGDINPSLFMRVSAYGLRSSWIAVDIENIDEVLKSELALIDYVAEEGYARLCNIIKARNLLGAEYSAVVNKYFESGKVPSYHDCII